MVMNATERQAAIRAIINAYDGAPQNHESITFTKEIWLQISAEYYVDAINRELSMLVALTPPPNEQFTDTACTRCPTCKQKLPDDKVLTRICWLCQNVMDKRDKWEYMKIIVDGKTAVVPRHRHCDNTQDYKPRKEKLNVPTKTPV